MNPNQVKESIQSLMQKYPFHKFFFLATVLSTSVTLHNYTGLFLLIPSLFITEPLTIRLSYFLSTILSNSPSTLILNFYLNLHSKRPAFEFILLEIIKTYFIGFTLESIFLLFLLSCISFLIEKDFGSLNLLNSIFSNSLKDKKNICDALESIVLFISEKGNIAKFNKAAEKMLGVQIGANFFELITTEKVQRVKNMIKIAIQNKIPEEDYTHYFPGFGKLNFVLSMKYVALENDNIFLLCFDTTNISAKKRRIVFNSYQENFALQTKVQKKILSAFAKNKKISFKFCCMLMNYIYCQQETINITEMVIGQIVVQSRHFNIKLEISNCIHFYWDIFKPFSVSLNLSCGDFPVFCGNRTKHHLLIKSLLYFTCSTLEPSTSIYLQVERSTNPNEVLYTCKYTSTKITPQDLNQVFLLDLEDIDSIISVQQKYGLTVSLFQWLLKNLSGKIYSLDVKDSLICIQFSLQFNLGEPRCVSQVYLADAFKEVIYQWPANLENRKVRIGNRKMIKRLMSNCKTEMVSEDMNEEHEGNLSRSLT